MRNSEQLKRGFQRCLRAEIAIEYKTCLYFACILFFYFVYLIAHRMYLASILYMFEMILTEYLISYIQAYLFHDSDGAKKLGGKDIGGILSGIFLHGAFSFGLGWYGRSIPATLLFCGYMLLVYLCVYLLNKIKRKLDTEHLNRMLAEFKERE